MKWFWTQYRGEIFAPGNGSLICPPGKKTRSKGQTWIPLGSRSHGGQNRPPGNQQHVQRRIRQTYLQVSVLQLIRLGTKTVTILFYSSCNQSTIVCLSIYAISVSISYSKRIIWSWWRVKQIFGRSELMRWLTLETRYHTDYCLIISTKVTQSWKANQISVTWW